jgi:hypothetical protein
MCTQAKHFIAKQAVLQKTCVTVAINFNRSITSRVHTSADSLNECEFVNYP